MNPETKTRKIATQQRQQETAIQLLSCIPSYVSGRNGQILLDSVYLTSEETGKRHDISGRRVEQIKQDHRNVYEALVKQRRNILSAMGEDAAYGALKELREYLNRKRRGPLAQSVQDARYLADVLVRLTTTVTHLASNEPPPDKAGLDTLGAKMDKLLADRPGEVG